MSCLWIRLASPSFPEVPGLRLHPRLQGYSVYARPGARLGSLLYLGVVTSRFRAPLVRLSPCWTTLRPTPTKTLRPPLALSWCSPLTRVLLHPPLFAEQDAGLRAQGLSAQLCWSSAWLCQAKSLTTARILAGVPAAGPKCVLAGQAGSPLPSPAIGPPPRFYCVLGGGLPRWPLGGYCCCDSHARSWVLAGRPRRSPVGRGGRSRLRGSWTLSVQACILTGGMPEPVPNTSIALRLVDLSASAINCLAPFADHNGAACLRAAMSWLSSPPPTVWPFTLPKRALLPRLLHRIAQSSGCLAFPRLLQQRQAASPKPPLGQATAPDAAAKAKRPSVANLAVQLETLASALPALTARLEEMDARQQDLASVISAEAAAPPRRPLKTSLSRRSWVHPRLRDL